MDTWAETQKNFTYYSGKNVFVPNWNAAKFSFLGGWNKDGTQDAVHQKEVALAACQEQDKCWGVLGLNPSEMSAGG